MKNKVKLDTGKVLVKVLPKAQSSFITDNKQDPFYGEVVADGNDDKRVGDTVLFFKHDGIEITIEDEKVMLLNSKDILLTLTK